MMRLSLSQRVPFWRLLSLFLVTYHLVGCQQEPVETVPERTTPPAILIGVDGVEWKVVHRLWEQGELPVLRDLVERGSSATLITGRGPSPVLWTTMATGVGPDTHGITGFVIPGENGDVPVSTSARQVPAIWNMASRARRRAVVLSWWPSWPVEEINGVVISERADKGLDDSVHPVDLRPLFEESMEDIESVDTEFDLGERIGRRDYLMSLWAEKLASTDFDLMLLYLRSPDMVSHLYWHQFEPEAFEHLDQETLPGSLDQLYAAYRATDQAIGKVVEAAPPEANVFIVSDHGFRAKTRREPTIQVQLDLDEVLKQLGYLVVSDEGVDVEASSAYTFDSPLHRLRKAIKISGDGSVVPRLKADLQAVTYASGRAAFEVHEPREDRDPEGADLMVEVLTRSPTQDLKKGDRTLTSAIKSISRFVSGTHGPMTPGIFIAAGPDIASGIDLGGIRIHDVTPTVLAALGLPVADDFEGRAWRELFAPSFQERHPARRIPTWNKMMQRTEPKASTADRELLEELRSLGYIVE